MRKADLALGAAVAALFLFIAIQSRGIPAPPVPRDDASPGEHAAARSVHAAIADSDDTAAAPAADTAHAPGVELNVVLDQRMEPLPVIDTADVARRLRLGAPGTYIDDVLGEQDRALVRWSDHTVDPLRVWVQPSFSAPGWSPSYPDAARAAFDDWAAVGIPERFVFVLDSSSADIRIDWTDRFGEDQRIGTTRRVYDRNWWIRSAQIVIAVEDSAGDALPADLVAATARHEVGHALGLGHSMQSPTDIMAPVARGLTLTKADRATMRLLYTLPPGVVH